MSKRVRLAAWAAGMIVVMGAPAAQAGHCSAPGHMGLSLEAWQEYRTGERGSARGAEAHSASGHLGLSWQAWQEYRAGERSS